MSSETASTIAPLGGLAQQHATMMPQSVSTAEAHPDWVTPTTFVTNLKDAASTADLGGLAQSNASNARSWQGLSQAAHTLPPALANDVAEPESDVDVDWPTAHSGHSVLGSLTSPKTPLPPSPLHFDSCGGSSPDHLERLAPFCLQCPACSMDCPVAATAVAASGRRPTSWACHVVRSESSESQLDVSLGRDSPTTLTLCEAADGAWLALDLELSAMLPSAAVPVAVVVQAKKAARAPEVEDATVESATHRLLLSSALSVCDDVVTDKARDCLAHCEASQLADRRDGHSHHHHHADAAAIDPHDNTEEETSLDRSGTDNNFSLLSTGTHTFPGSPCGSPLLTVHHGPHTMTAIPTTITTITTIATIATIAAGPVVTAAPSAFSGAMRAGLDARWTLPCVGDSLASGASLAPVEPSGRADRTARSPRPLTRFQPVTTASCDDPRRRAPIATPMADAAPAPRPVDVDEGSSDRSCASTVHDVAAKTSVFSPATPLLTEEAATAHDGARGSVTASSGVNQSMWSDNVPPRTHTAGDLGYLYGETWEAICAQTLPELGTVKVEVGAMAKAGDSAPGVFYTMPERTPHDAATGEQGEHALDEETTTTTKARDVDRIAPDAGPEQPVISLTSPRASPTRARFSSLVNPPCPVQTNVLAVDGHALPPPSSQIRAGAMDSSTAATTSLTVRPVLNAHGVCADLTFASGGGGPRPAAPAASTSPRTAASSAQALAMRLPQLPAQRVPSAVYAQTSPTTLLTTSSSPGGIEASGMTSPLGCLNVALSTAPTSGTRTSSATLLSMEPLQSPGPEDSAGGGADSKTSSCDFSTDSSTSHSRVSSGAMFEALPMFGVSPSSTSMSVASLLAAGAGTRCATRLHTARSPGHGEARGQRRSPSSTTEVPPLSAIPSAAHGASLSPPPPPPPPPPPMPGGVYGASDAADCEDGTILAVYSQSLVSGAIQYDFGRAGQGQYLVVGGNAGAGASSVGWCGATHSRSRSHSQPHSHLCTPRESHARSHEGSGVTTPCQLPALPVARRTAPGSLVSDGGSPRQSAMWRRPIPSLCRPSSTSLLLTTLLDDAETSSVAAQSLNSATDSLAPPVTLTRVSRSADVTFIGESKDVPHRTHLESSSPFTVSRKSPGTERGHTPLALYPNEFEKTSEPE